MRLISSDSTYPGPKCIYAHNVIWPVYLQSFCYYEFANKPMLYANRAQEEAHVLFLFSPANRSTPRI